MAVERTPSGSSLIDVLDRVLDKGIVIDAWVRVSLVGIDLVTVEAPDYTSAGAYLLNEVSAMAGGLPAALLRFVSAQDALVFVNQVKLRPEDARQLPESLEDRGHPLVVCALALSPVVRESDHMARVARLGRFGPIHDWSALPLPQPHYRGAPALILEAQA